MIKKRKNIKDELIVEDELYLLAYFDQLTLMPNEKYFYEELDFKISESNKKDFYAAVYLKVNNLENLHNILGFEKSSEFISELADHIKDNNDAELISLYQRNKFLLCYELQNGTNTLKNKLNRLLLMVKKFISAKNYEYLLSVNIGAAIYPEHSESASDILTKAHNAVYTIANDINSYQIYDEKIFLQKLEKEALKQDLKQAIEDEEFYLKFQPKVKTDQEKITAVEALIRWDHRDKGSISPAEFIPLAEKTGLIKKIGILVLKEVFETLRLWQKKGLKDIKVGINISLIELNDPKILNNIKYIADSYSIDNSMIEFEITERSFIEISEEILDEIKNMGFSIALDDFGTGYSSLSFLNKLAIDILKLDKTFIDKVNETKTRKLVDGVIKISHDLGLKVVAEGVENKDQLEILKDLKCDYIQGYYFYRPMLRNNVEKLIN
jgi:EAL domain-containing protein (putative c-di-GMP-specific phosphodiesterase class I)/GGDEF domain-containing protein